jgi:spore germination protein GerM
MPTDVLETRLRRALNAEADAVQISGDGLRNIRAGIEGQRFAPVWWRRPALAVAAAAVLGLAAGGVGVALTHDSDDRGSNLPASTGTASPTGSPSGSPSPSASTSAPTKTAVVPPPTSSGGAVTTRSLSVYYLSDPDNTGPRLYREFHKVQVTGNAKGGAAVADMLRGSPVDPDYVSLWPKTTKVLHYSVSGGVATVDLSKAALTSSQAGSQGAEMSLQQLVYTVQGAEGNAALKIRLLIGGKPVTELWGAASVDQPLTRADPMTVRGWVWISTPAQGATVGSPVSVELNGGYGFEGNVVLKFLRNGTEVKTDSMTTQGDAFVVVSKKFALDPGSWELRAYQDSGENGDLALRDSKTFTVK